MSQTQDGLKGKVGVVTGASKGIGRAIAIALAQAGASVVVNYLQDIAAANETCAQITQLERLSLPLQCDVRIRADVEGLLQQTLSSFGRVDVLVNNAGIRARGDLWSINETDWDSIIATNLKGAFLCSQMFGEVLFSQRFGHIVNISSTAGIRPLGGSHHYVASKAGLIGLTKVLALTLAPYVTVNSIAPGLVKGSGNSQRTEKDQLISRIPMGRMASAHEIASFVVFLVTDGTYITGQTIAIDGGLTID